jgi:hypothetical protein
MGLRDSASVVLRCLLFVTLLSHCLHYCYTIVYLLQRNWAVSIICVCVCVCVFGSSAFVLQCGVLRRLS